MVIEEMQKKAGGKGVIKTNIRFRILLLVFVNVVINYMDRTNISVAATSLSDDLKLSSVQLGLLFSAFGWTYALMQIPGGLLVDRIAPRLLYAISLICWSGVTLLQGLATKFATLFCFRLSIGALEAPAYPINNKIVTSWFPYHERAFAIAAYTSGQYVGLAFLTPLMVTIEYYWGWQILFMITGVVGIAWGIIWYWRYRSPAEHIKVNQEELDYIEKDKFTSTIAINSNNEQKNQPINWKNLAFVFSNSKLWGIYIGQFAINANVWFFLTWFPTYLVKYRGIDFLKSGFLSSIPFIAAFIGILLSGFLSDLMIRKGVSINIARKAPILVGLLLSVSIIGANYVSDPFWIILFMTTAFFGTGLASITWIFVSTLAPKNLLGLTGGAFNFVGNLSSIATPLIIGVLVEGGDFSPALIFIAILALVGIFAYTFMVGKLHQIET